MNQSGRGEGVKTRNKKNQTGEPTKQQKGLKRGPNQTTKKNQRGEQIKQ